MAVQLVYRAIIVLTPVAYRVVHSSETFGAPKWPAVAEWMWDRIRDPGESDEDLSVALSEHTGTVSSVATYSGAFEVRRLQASWSLAAPTGVSEDVRVCTFHFLKLTAGAPDATWAAGDFTTLATAFDTFWTSVKIYFPSALTLARLAVYREGPDVAPPQPPAYDVTRSVPGTASGSSVSLPPQVAISVTEKAGTQLHWGRFYLPAPATLNSSGVAVITGYGRLMTAAQTAIADATDTFYESMRTANLPAVVYRRPLPVRTTKGGTELPARTASAWTVEQVQVDDVLDVIRSRRYDRPTLRVQRTIGP